MRNGVVVTSQRGVAHRCGDMRSGGEVCVVGGDFVMTAGKRVLGEILLGDAGRKIVTS
jgi:hypothetical protein